MKATRGARQTIFFLATAALLSGSAASAQNAPYVGAYEADNFFSTITTNEMNVLRTKKILFLSRSFGINMVEGLARLEAKNPVYDFNSSYIKYEVQTFGLGTVATNAFANYNFVHCMATYYPHTQRLIELSTLLRDPPYSFGTQVDVVMVDYHTATAALFDTYKSTMDSLQAEFPNVKFIYVTSGFSGPQYATDNANSAAFGALVRAEYKGKVPLYDWGYILSNDGECGDVSCPENITDPTGLHSDSPIGEERVGKAFLLMLRDLYFGSGCTNLAPPTVPGNLSGTALSDSSIRLTWDPSEHECGVARYELTRNGTMLTSLTKTNYTDTGLTENTAYRYALRAVSMAEVASAYSSTSTVSTLVDSTAPTVTLARAVSGTAISVTFSENLSSVSAQTATNYTLNYGVSVLSASLSGKTVTLFTSEMSNGTNYTLTINHVADASSATNSIAPGTQVSFTYLRVNYPEDPVAWWKFDGTLADASGNSLTGAWKNSIGTYTNALLGPGLALVAGSTGYVQVANNNLLDGMTNGMTISIWAKKQDANLGGMLFIKSGAYRFGVFSNTFAYHFGTTQKTQYGAVPAISNINNTSWHHYCMSYNGSNLTLSVDGTQRYSYSMTGDVVTVSSSLYIGIDPYTPFKVVTNTVVTGTVVIVTNTVAAMSSFDGQLDEMKIFRRALSTNEIFGLYTNGLTGSADRQAVRNILDANGLTNRTVDSGSFYQKDRITKLYVQEAGVSNLTADIGALSELTLLHCYGDRSLGFPMLTSVAPEIGSCSLLTELLLAQNSLTNLPSSITNLTKLTVCSIGDNLLCGSYPWENWADTVDPDWRATQDCGSPLSPTAAFSVNVISGTVPLAVTFTDSSTETITNRYWDFGDGTATNITSTSIAHTYASTGTYTVALTVTGPAGTDTNTKTNLITVNPPAPPSAAFSASPLSGTAPLAVTFNDTSTGTITNRYWNFGDDTTTNITSTSITHTYASTGTYTAALTVTGPAGTNTNTKTNLITVNPPAPPSAAFSASPISGPASLAVTFTDTSTGSITNHYWNFGDGVTSNTMATSLVHTYSSTGTYTVALTVSGPGGSATNTQNNVITVTTPPLTAGFGVSPASGTAPLAVTFTDTSIGSITNRYWNFGDGVTSNTTATSLGHTYSSTGTYTVALTVSGPSGANTNTQISVISVTAASSSTNGTANIISVNFCDWNGATVPPRNPMLSISLAGAPGVRVDNWNNIQASTGTNRTGSTLVYDDGTTVGGAFKIAYTSPRAGGQAANTLLNDALMFSGYDQVWNNQTNKVVLTDIPFANYDIYIYADAANANGGGRISMEGQQDYWVKTLAAMLINTTNNTGAGYKQITYTTQESAVSGPGGSGNYVLYSGLSGSSQTFTTAAMYMGNANHRLALAGFQIVQIAEAPPVAGFTASPTSGVSSLAVTFTDTSIGSITNRFWDFGDGATTNTTATSLNHTYASTGTYSVALIVSGVGGASTSTQSNLITASAPVVVPPPAPTVALGSSGAFGRGQDVLSWTTVQGSGYVYGVWYSTNLLNGFLPLQTNLADTVKSLTNIINAPSVFYKIEVQ
jgi:PKD repeat protein